MKLRNYLSLVCVVGGLAFGVTSVSANCGSCEGKEDKSEHTCPAGCQKECCKDKKKDHAADCACDGCKEKAACAEGCQKECCKDKKKDS